MNYIEMVRNAPKKSESIMWDSVQSISDLLEKVENIHPELAHSFLMKEYGKMYGKHFNETFAKEVVEGMYHNNEQGEKVTGEVVSFEDSQMLIEDKENREQLQWDAYVGANGFVHDLWKSGMNTADIMRLAKIFWFEDDDFQFDSKVFWYYSNK